MVHLQAPDYSIPWADEEFVAEFVPIKDRKCYEIMHGRNSPCEKCPTFKAFEAQDTVVSEWHREDGRVFMTIAEPLSPYTPLLIEFIVELKLPYDIN